MKERRRKGKWKKRKGKRRKGKITKTYCDKLLLKILLKFIYCISKLCGSCLVRL